MTFPPKGAFEGPMAVLLRKPPEGSGKLLTFPAQPPLPPIPSHLLEEKKISCICCELALKEVAFTSRLRGVPWLASDP